MEPILWPALAACAALAGAVGVELALRWYWRHRSRSFVNYPNSRLTLYPHPDISEHLDKAVECRTNELGDRGGPVPKGPGRVMRGLVLGGSAAECMFLDQEKSWPAVLETLLQKASGEGRLPQGRVYIGNVARSLVNPQGLLRVASQILPEREPQDWIIIMTGNSVVVHWMTHGAGLKAAVPLYSDDDLFAVCPGTQFTWTLKGSATRRALAFAKRRWRPQVLQNAGRFLLKNRRMRAAATQFVKLPPVAESRYFAESCQYLRELIRLCRQHASRVIVIGQGWLEYDALSPEQAKLPWFGCVGDLKDSHFASLKSLSDAFEVVHRATLALAREEGAETLDARQMVPGRIGLLYDDGHYSNTGSRMLAESLTEYILAGKPPA